jgi:hypothetical protein
MGIASGWTDERLRRQVAESSQIDNHFTLAKAACLADHAGATDKGIFETALAHAVKGIFNGTETVLKFLQVKRIRAAAVPHSLHIVIVID